jgi:catechol 2,3-dioxygenase-like lactoylglutathione lyase family enzyme
MNITQIKETCIYCRDLERASAFYNGLLGLPVISYVKEKHIFFRAGSSVLLCFNPDDSRRKKSPPAHFGEGKMHFAFEVLSEDFGKTKSGLVAKGIVITDTIVWETGRESFYFEDPFGHVLEIVPTGIWE